MFFQITNKSVGEDSSSLDDFLDHVNFVDQPGYSTTSNGFTGILSVTGKPFFDPTQIGRMGNVPSSVPVRIPLDSKTYLPRAVSESRAFTYETESAELWNPKYKKALQGAKSLTSMTPAEGDQLEALIHRNNDKEYSVSQDSYPGSTAETLSIDDRLDQDESSPTTRNTQPGSIDDLSLDEIPMTSGNQFRVEKTLEAWLMEMIDSEHPGIREIFGPADELSWFTNYVPYGISGKNMDGLAFHRRDNVRYKISTIELKCGRAKKGAVKQVIRYARWVTNYLADGDENAVQPILIANRFSDGAKSAAQSQIDPRPPILASYEITGNTCHLNIKAGQPGG